MDFFLIQFIRSIQKVIAYIVISNEIGFVIVSIFVMLNK